MNPTTGHVKVLDGVPFDGYVALPRELYGAAESVLKGRTKARVSLTSGGRLSRWAAQQRKARRKMASNSRKRNRR